MLIILLSHSSTCMLFYDAISGLRTLILANGDCLLLTDVSGVLDP
jgi:hypothetical protein